jgi:hypothetical protein
VKINNQTKSYLQLTSWFLYLLLFPFQLFPPGSPQIADLPMMIGVFSIFFEKWFIDNYIKSLSYFVFYSILVGIFYSIIYYDIEFLKSPLNYFYCLTSLVFVSQIANHSKFISSTIFAIFISLLIQLYVFKSVGFNEEEARFILYFNNPNQLGLWALSLLLFLSFIFQTYKYKKSTKYILIISFILCILFISLSISQAAILSTGLIIISIIINYFRYKLIFILLPIIILFSSLFNTELLNSDMKILINIQNRVNNEINEDDGDNGLDGRNYTRLLNYAEYLFLGAGEARVNRFGNDGLEIHSTYANILFSYGIFGLIFVILPIINFIKRKSLILIMLLGSYLIFTLVHNTFRWPLFWIIPYLLYFNSSFNQKKI